MNIHDDTNFCLVNTLMITDAFGFSFVSRGIPTADVSACLVSLWMPFLMQPSYLSRLWDWHTFGKALFVSPPSLLILKKMSKSLMLAFKIHWSQAYQKLLYIVMVIYGLRHFLHGDRSSNRKQIMEDFQSSSWKIQQTDVVIAFVVLWLKILIG